MAILEKLQDDSKGRDGLEGRWERHFWMCVIVKFDALSLIFEQDGLTRCLKFDACARWLVKTL